MHLWDINRTFPGGCWGPFEGTFFLTPSFPIPNSAGKLRGMRPRLCDSKGPFSRSNKGYELRNLQEHVKLRGLRPSLWEYPTGNWHNSNFRSLDLLLVVSAAIGQMISVAQFPRIQAEKVEEHALLFAGPFSCVCFWCLDLKIVFEQNGT